MDWRDRALNWTERLDPKKEDPLWQLSGIPSGAPSQASESLIDDEAIERYRRGELSAEERRRFEERLAEDERGMERLARVITRPAVRRQPTLRLAASILVGGLATAGLFYAWQTDSVETAAAIPSYTIDVQGLAERRGLETEASFETRLGSTVRIVARPATAPGPDVGFALYRRDRSGSLTRVRGAEAAIQVERGTAVLEAEAGALVGTAPGLYELVFLIGSDDFTAPARIAHSGLDDLVQAYGLQAHAFELRLLPTDGGDRAAGQTQKAGGVGGGQGGGGGPISWEFYAAPCPDFLNLTRSAPLSEAVYLDALFLRTGESF